MIELLCLNCGGAVAFGADGWDHRDPGRSCACLQVAWPPPLPDDD